jgi:[ribosomal protein S5]-alanine N-acetyltransferase
MDTNSLDEADFIECACPFCGQQLSFPVTHVSTAQTCIRCMEVVIVPDGGADTAKKLPLPLTTSRLQLRRFRSDDWKDVREIWYDADDPAAEEESIHFLGREAKSKLSEGDYLGLAMEVTSSSKVVGYVSIKYTDDARQQGYIWVQVNPAFRGQGYATEAVSAILAFGFETLRLHRITASFYSQETRYGRLLERVGMRREGEAVEDHFADGKWESTTYYAILASEFRERSSAR